MAEKNTVLKGKVKHSGLFDFKDLYNFLYDWINEEDYSIKETLYKEEKLPDGSKNIDIAWEANKKISDYFKYTIKLDWKILGLKKAKAKREGKEISINDGLLELKIKAVIVKDYEDKWENHPLWKFLRGIYDKYIIRSRTSEYEDTLKEDTKEIIAQTKAFLKIEGQI